jgi:hypothetical protein
MMLRVCMLRIQNVLHATPANFVPVQEQHQKGERAVAVRRDPWAFFRPEEV